MTTAHKRIYLGTWFQRTSLHLKEFFDFLEGRNNAEGLDKAKLASLRNQLDVSNVRFFRKRGFDVVAAQSKEVDISMTEDGILLMHAEFKDTESVAKGLERFYSEKLGPAMSYLFSRGAPLPKDLTAVREIYPLYMVGHKLNKDDVDQMFSMISDSPFSSYVKRGDIEIIRGDELVVINFLGETIDHELVEELVRNTVLFREFEKQLGQYLNLHRTLWDKITVIRESTGVTLQKFPAIRSQVLDYLKTLSFVKARLSQMEDILVAREATLHETMPVKKILEDLDLMSRFQMFKASQSYLLRLWDVTTEYAEGTITMLDSLLNENTQREIGILQVITFVGVLTGFFGMNIAFPWQSEWAVAFKYSFFVVGLIILLSFLTRYMLNQSVYKRRIRMK